MRTFSVLTVKVTAADAVGVVIIRTTGAVAAAVGIAAVGVTGVVTAVSDVTVNVLVRLTSRVTAVAGTTVGVSVGGRSGNAGMGVFIGRVVGVAVDKSTTEVARVCQDNWPPDDNGIAKPTSAAATITIAAMR